MKFTKQVNRYGVFEGMIEGPSEGNPFTEQRVTGVFTGAGETAVVDGFYDGDGIYKIRFMPSYEGKYSFTIRSSFGSEAETGKFYVGPAAEGVHGPVHVSGQYHFAYADGTDANIVGTTAYAWALQSDEKIGETLHQLSETSFNKIRMCIFPKHYVHNLTDPRSFPYEGTPMDASVLNEDNFMGYFGQADGNDFDYERFNPAYFQHLETCIYELSKIGIQADLILFHPYDRWGFSTMSAEQDDLYVKYAVARLSAFHNVWWSMANEYDLLFAKTTADWERLAELVRKKDPYGHLRSIHNCRYMYDHSRPWITHCSVQRVDLYKSAELTDEIRERYGKPVVMDEIAYEGDLPEGFGNITGEEMLRRCYEAVMRGGYPGHSETYYSEDGIFWSHGGSLKGESWKRMDLLKKIMDEVPGGLMPYDGGWDVVAAAPENEWMNPLKSQYLFYYSFMRPRSKTYHIDDETEFAVDVIDTWNGTVKKAGVYKGKFTVELPGTQYVLVRLRKPEEADYYPEEEEETEVMEETVPEDAPVEEPVVEEEPVTEETAAVPADETAETELISLPDLVEEVLAKQEAADAAAEPAVEEAPAEEEPVEVPEDVIEDIRDEFVEDTEEFTDAATEELQVERPDSPNFNPEELLQKHYGESSEDPEVTTVIPVQRRDDETEEESVDLDLDAYFNVGRSDDSLDNTVDTNTLNIPPMGRHDND